MYFTIQKNLNSNVDRNQAIYWAIKLSDYINDSPLPSDNKTLHKIKTTFIKPCIFRCMSGALLQVHFIRFMSGALYRCMTGVFVR